MYSSNEQKTFNIALLPGDGVGPQLALHAKQTFSLIERIRNHVSFHVSEYDFGGASIAAGAEIALPPSTLDACRNADTVLLCGCGDKIYGLKPEKALLALREELGVCVNVRPVLLYPAGSLVQVLCLAWRRWCISKPFHSPQIIATLRTSDPPH